MKLIEIALMEAVYKGNIGMMEMFRFHQIATPDEKALMKSLLAAGKQDDAWELLKRVTKTALK